MTEFPLTLAAYREAYASGSLTPKDAVREVYRRIAAHGDPAIFITLRPEAEVAADAETLPAGPLHGIPVAVKDNIDVAGLPTTCACPDYAAVAASDAEVVARLRRAGALVIGKTNLDQFATGLVGVRSPYGVPRNTLDPALVPGGSSSGSAVAVAAGLVPLALGTDTAGSGRVPAGLNAIVGLDGQRIIELGCGPFSNMRVAVSTVKVETIELLDPLIEIGIGAVGIAKQTLRAQPGLGRAQQGRQVTVGGRNEHGRRTAVTRNVDRVFGEAEQERGARFGSPALLPASAMARPSSAACIRRF
mgnify:CR=1 FL=1